MSAYVCASVVRETVDHQHVPFEAIESGMFDQFSLSLNFCLILISIWLQEAVHPTSLKLMQIADSPQTPKELKRKLPVDESNTDLPPKKKAAKEEHDGGSSDLTDTPSESADPTPSCSTDIGSRSKTKMSKRFENVTIPRGGRPDTKNMPQQM